MPKKIVIVTEAYDRIQINGVVTTLYSTKYELEKMGYDVILLTPEKFRTISMPSYKEIDLVINPWKVWGILNDEKPDYIHIATEGPLALFTKWYCDFTGLKYSSSYHTKLPEYINKRYSFVPPSLIYSYLRYLHKNSKSILVTTESMKRELTEHRFKNLVVWGRGVDGVVFNSSQRVTSSNGKKKLLYVGRVSIEKNLEAFFKLNTDEYELYVVGDGPMYDKYVSKFPHVHFLGAKKGFELAWWFANCDVFVFPSLTDTFGIVMIEASRCGTPVAAFPVTGPIDYVKEGVTGSLDWNLEIAVKNCLAISRVKCEEAASKFTWKNVALTFKDNLIST